MQLLLPFLATSPSSSHLKSGLTISSWGYYIPNYLSISVSNLARNGRSTRSFINQGLWASLLASTNAGKMIVDVRAKKATPVLSGMVPRNYWSGNTLQSVWPFAVYAQEVAIQTSVEYVGHTKYSVDRWQALGPTTAKTYYPNDNTHTSPAGALINAQAFVTALKCANSPLVAYLNSAGTAVNYSC
ncbi:SGNH hydrolase-type esterase domain-containing protein [Leptodontidium sp. MPI-SDFR-AT-0119]|nr:SGNH hydrolase-type esterase domain-containing protein [Leptodontidium sp. MPI-SDFR-AT-0119]